MPKWGRAMNDWPTATITKKNLFRVVNCLYMFIHLIAFLPVFFLSSNWSLRVRVVDTWSSAKYFSYFKYEDACCGSLMYCVGTSVRDEKPCISHNLPRTLANRLNSRYISWGAKWGTSWIVLLRSLYKIANTLRVITHNFLRLRGIHAQGLVLGTMPSPSDLSIGTPTDIFMSYRWYTPGNCHEIAI